jgi:DNA-binding transcriptional LysR family regulator
VNDDASPIGNELDLRSLRYFVAAAEELHFTRAAARLFVAQQALSREIASLERRIGTELFVRTTRRVKLTPSGERLLVRARELLALHDVTWREVRPAARPIVVDLLSEGRRTGVRILEAARAAAPDVEFRGRYGDGAGSAAARIDAGDLDVAFGRAEWVGRPGGWRLEHRLVRYEPLALLLPTDHELAAQPAVPLSALRGAEIDANLYDPGAPEWGDIGRQLIALAGARSTPPHPPAIGLAEAALHLVRQGLPILTGIDQAEIPGGVVRPIVGPVPIYPWSIVFRAGPIEPGAATLLETAQSLAAAEGWLELPPGAWLPLPESAHVPNSGD